MAEKGETKILVIITICIILISIGISGCVGDDGDKEKELDTDMDKLPDKDDPDDDNDGILDEWETKYGLNSKDSTDKYDDVDHDGVDNKNEFDTDTNPLDSNKFNLQMKENLTRYGIPLYKTALFLFRKLNETDFDDDGIPDSWEVAFGLNATNPSDLYLDFDYDGYTNKAEYDAETDPIDLQ